MSVSTTYQLLMAIRKAMKDSGSFQYVGYFPEEVKKATGQIQNTKTDDYAACIIEDGNEDMSEQYTLNGFDNIDYNIGIYILMSRGKGTIIKRLHDYEIIIKNIMSLSSTYSGLSVNLTRFISTEKGQPTGDIDENNMIGYADGIVGRKLNYTINMQVTRAGNC